MAQETKQVNITIEAGADFLMTFVVRDDGGRLIDLTGATVEAQLREYAEASDYLQFTATHNGSGGRVTISMVHEDTAAIPYDSGVYDVFITDANNNREKYIMGDVEIEPNVTKPVAGEIIYLLSFAAEEDFPSVGMVRRIYFSHASNKMYRWNGTNYVSIITDGEAATVEVGDVETLPAGSDATVVNSGSLLNAVFDFGIPEGNGIASIEKTGSDVLTDTYTITFTDPNVAPVTFDVENGNGIASIVKTGSDENIDHYRISFTDGTYFDYDVTNVDTSEFYDKSEVDAFLADKANTADLGNLAFENSVAYTDITGTPTLGSMASVNDAPSDDKPYARKNGQWAEVTGGGGGSASWGAISGTLSDQTDLQTALDNKAPVILNSASGSIASFADGFPAPVKSLSVAIEPVQDLHGYDNPWPAGGGANQWDEEWEVGIYNSGNGTKNDSVTTRIRTKNPIPVLPETTYYKVAPSDGFRYLVFYDNDMTFLSTLNPGAGNQSFTTPANAYFMNTYTEVDTYGTTYKHDMAINYPSTVTTYSPYSNICPISGHTSATVTRTGKNLLSEIINGRYNLNSDFVINDPTDTKYRSFKMMMKVGTYTISFGVAVNIVRQGIGAPVVSISQTNVTSYTFTVPKEEYVGLSWRRYDDTDWVSSTFVQLELGSTASSYEPYQGQSLTIDLDGTRYGGTLDVLTGEMTVTKAMVDLGTLEWATRATGSTNKLLSTNIQNDYYSNYGLKVNGVLLSNYPYVGASSASALITSIETAESGFYTYNNYAYLVNVIYLVISKDSAPVGQFVYPLAEPLTIQLSSEQMQTLKGQNRIWSDTGDTEVTYRADTKLYIDEQIAESQRKTRSLITGIETTMVASKNYSEGDLLIVGDTLYKTTATIASGGTLTVGINVTATTVAEQLIALANA